MIGRQARIFWKLALIAAVAQDVCQNLEGTLLGSA